MAGKAKTNKFMLGDATLMLGAMSEVFDLNPVDHSIGLVKNLQVQSQPGFTELKQGVKNQLIYSVHTSNDVRLSAEVYEFTTKNMSYALGLDASSITSTSVSSTVETAVDGTTIPVTDFDVAAGDGANFSEGDDILISIDNDDNVIVRQIESVTTDTITVDKEINVAVPAGATVKKCSVIRIGNTDSDNVYLGAKAVGVLANGERVALILPKVKITGGFTLQFQTNDYGNLPLELSLFDSIPGDPYYSDFKSEQAKLFAA